LTTAIVDVGATLAEHGGRVQRLERSGVEFHAEAFAAEIVLEITRRRRPVKRYAMEALPLASGGMHGI
jgi:hypothetical protein